MSSIRIRLDSYKSFFKSESGLKLLNEIIKRNEYETIKEIAEWEECPAKILNSIAIKYMVIENEQWKAKKNLEILEAVVENPKLSVKMLGKIFEFVLIAVDSNLVRDVLEEIAESEKLTSDIAMRLYEIAEEENFAAVLEALADNKKTPDEILFNILDTFSGGSELYKLASEEIVVRYRELKEDKSKKDEE